MRFIFKRTRNFLPALRESFYDKAVKALDLTDNGDPGTNDFFSVHFSNGYSASGFLTTGSIQIH